MTSLASQAGQWPPIQALRRAGLAAVDRLEGAVHHNHVYAMAVAAVMALQYLLIFTHEPWLDEWQALQIALESHRQSDLLANLRYEGHPPLWYWLLQAIGHFAPPQWILAWAAALLATAAQSIVLLRSPLTRAERLLLALGCFLMFEFLTVSRSLTLGVTVLISTAQLWRTRWVWLAIAILPLCDFLFGVLSGAMIVLQVREGRTWLPGIAMWAVVAAFSAWTVVPAPDLAPALERLGFATDLANVVLRMGLLLVPLQWSGTGPAWDAFPPLGLGLLLAIGFFAFAWRELRSDRLDAMLFFGFVAIAVLFSIVVYPLAARHLMLIALLLIVLVWLRAADGRPASAGFRLWVLVGALCGLFVAGWNLAVPFDTAGTAAREIRARGLQDEHWVAFPASRAQGVSALTGLKFESLEAGCAQSFVRWNTPQTIQTPAELQRALEAKLAQRGRFYLLSDLPLSILPRSLVAPVAEIAPGYDGQAFNLYEVGPGIPVRPVTIPDCVPGLPRPA
jgi:hypothetical protein